MTLGSILRQVTSMEGVVDAPDSDSASAASSSWVSVNQ